MRIDINPEVLQATIEAMHDLQARYEAEAVALAQLDSRVAKELAQERLESANVARGLSDFYAGQ